MPEDKIPYAQFAAKVKAKYPQYANVDDLTLAKKMVDKYPAYASQVDFGGEVSDKKKEESTAPTLNTPMGQTPQSEGLRNRIPKDSGNSLNLAGSNFGGTSSPSKSPSSEDQSQSTPTDSPSPQPSPTINRDQFYIKNRKQELQSNATPAPRKAVQVSTADGTRFNVLVPTTTKDEDVRNLQTRIKNKAPLPEDLKLLSEAGAIDEESGQAKRRKTQSVIETYIKEGSVAGSQEDVIEEAFQRDIAVKDGLADLSRYYTKHTQEELLSNPNAAREFLDYFENLPEPQRRSIGSYSAGVGSGGVQLESDDSYNSRQDVIEYNNQLRAYQKIKKNYQAVVEKGITDKLSSGQITKDDAIKQIADLNFPELRRLSEESDFNSSSTGALAFSITKKLLGLGSDETERENMLNIPKGLAEEKLNNAIHELVVEKSRRAVKEGDANLAGQAQELLKHYDDKFIERYPTLKEQRYTAALTDYISKAAGNVEGEDTQDLSLKIFGDQGSKLEYARRYGKENGLMGDPVFKKILEDINDSVDKVGESSYIGGMGKSFADVSINQGKGLLDLVGWRTDRDIAADAMRDIYFPQQAPDLSGTTKIIQNIANTTAQVGGFAATQFLAGRGMGAAGVTGKTGQRLSSLLTGTLTSYDGHYKEAMQITDNPAARTFMATTNAIVEGVVENLFNEAKLIDNYIPQVRKNISEIATKIGTNDFSREVANELLESSRQAIADFGKKYAKNIWDEGREEVLAGAFSDMNKMIFGDPDMDVPQIIKNAGETFYQTAIGTSLIAGWGAHSDRVGERNSSYKKALYDAAISHDAVEDAIRKGFTSGMYDQNEMNNKLQILNTARKSMTELPQVERMIGRELGNRQRQVYVANRTAEAVLNKELEGVGDNETLRSDIEQRISNLKEQRQRILGEDIQFDETLTPVAPVQETVETPQTVTTPTTGTGIETTPEISEEEQAAIDQRIADNQQRLSLPTAPEIRLSDAANSVQDKISNGQEISPAEMKTLSDELYDRYRVLNEAKNNSTRRLTREQYQSSIDNLAGKIEMLESLRSQTDDNTTALLDVNAFNNATATEDAAFETAVNRIENDEQQRESFESFLNDNPEAAASVNAGLQEATSGQAEGDTGAVQQVAGESGGTTVTPATEGAASVTPEGVRFVQSQGDAPLPTEMTDEIRQIATDNGIVVTDQTSPSDVFNELRSRLVAPNVSTTSPEATTDATAASNTTADTNPQTAPDAEESAQNENEDQGDRFSDEDVDVIRSFTPEEFAEFEEAMIDTDNPDRAMEIINRKRSATQPTQTQSGNRGRTVSAKNKTSMAQLEAEYADDKTKASVIQRARKAIESIQQAFPNLDIRIHEDDASYNAAMDEVGGLRNTAGNFSFTRSENGEATPYRIDINLSRANERTVAHEVTHPVLLQRFKANQKVFAQFVKDIASILDESTDARLREFASNYTADVAPEEYLAELSGLMAEMDGEIPVSRKAKILQAINKVVSAVTGGRFIPFRDVANATETLEYFRSLANAINNGRDLSSALNAKQSYSGDVAIRVNEDRGFSPEDFGSRAQLGQYNHETSQNLPVKSLADVIKQYKGRVVMLTSDATGYGQDSDGNMILGGYGFTTNKKNIADNIGFASVDEGTVKSMLTRSYNLLGEGKAAALVMIQNPSTTIGNSYGAYYFGKGLRQLSNSPKDYKKVVKSFEEWINGNKSVNADLMKNDSKSGKRNTKQALIDLIRGVKPDTDLNQFVNEFLKDTSFNSRTSALYSLMVNHENVRTDSSTPYIKTMLKEAGFNKTAFLREYGDKTFLNEDMIREDIGGFVIGGFEIDLISDRDTREANVSEAQKRGIEHPLFNAKVEGTNHFTLDGLYDVNKNFAHAAERDTVITLSKDQRDEMVREIYKEDKHYKPQHHGISLDERTYTHLVDPKKIEFKEKHLAPRGFIAKDSKPKDVATSVAGSKGFPIEQSGPSILMKTQFVSRAQVAHDETGFVTPEAMIAIVAQNDPTYLRSVVNHIVTMADRLRSGNVGVRDVTKAYMITVASTNAGAQSVENFQTKSGGVQVPEEFIDNGNIRPESAMALFFTTRQGERFLDAVEKGEVTERNMQEMLPYAQPFGQWNSWNAGKLHTTFGKRAAGEVNLNNVHQIRDVMARGISNDDDLKNMIGSLKGIGGGKVGFVSQFLGVGSRGVIDARETHAWLRGYLIPKGQITEQEQIIKDKLQGNAQRDEPLRQEIYRRMEIVGREFGLPSELAQYIGHHMIWDAVSSEQTTHEAIYNVMRDGAPAFDAGIRIQSRSQVSQQQIAGSYIEPHLTETTDGKNYVFFHVSNAPEDAIRKGINSTKQFSTRTSNEEKATQYGIASYYTKEDDGERMVQGRRYEVKVPKDKVYPLDLDPNGYKLIADVRVKKGEAYREAKMNKVVADLAKRDGYQMMVSEWNYDRANTKDQNLALRADALVVLKPEKDRATYRSNWQKGIRTIHPDAHTIQYQRKMEKFAELVSDYLSARGRYDDAYDLAESVRIDGGIREGRGTANETVRPLTSQEYATMTTGLPKSLMAKSPVKIQSRSQVSDSVFDATNAEAEVARIKALPEASEDGATMNLDGTTYTGGGLVIPAASLNTTQDAITAESIGQFISDNKGKIASNNFKVGLYKFPNSSQVSIDLNIIADPANRDVAVEFGRLAGQESLFDLDTFENIKTGADGANPAQFTDEQFSEIASALSEGRMPQVFEIQSRSQNNTARRTQSIIEQRRQALRDLNRQGLLSDDRLSELLFELDARELRSRQRATGAGLPLRSRIANIQAGTTAETLPFGANETLAEAGFDQKGRPPQYNRTTIPLMAQANLDFIEQLNQETGGKAVEELLNYYMYRENNGVSPKNLDVTEFSTAQDFALVNTLLSYIHTAPISELNLSPAQVARYERYLQKMTKAIGNQLGKSLNTAKFSRMIRYTVQDLVSEGILDNNEADALDSARDQIGAIFAGEKEMTDEELAAAEEEQAYEDEDVQAEKSGLVSKVVNLLQKKGQLEEAISEKKSDRTIKRIEREMKKTDNEIRDLLNQINCD